MNNQRKKGGIVKTSFLTARCKPIVYIGSTKLGYFTKLPIRPALSGANRNFTVIICKRVA